MKVIDFGLAKAANRASKTAAGVIKGKVAYMSPEQAVGAPIDRRTDVFALGTTLWELACDRRLFKQRGRRRDARARSRGRRPRPDALRRRFPAGALGDPASGPSLATTGERYRTAAEMARALDAFAGATAERGAVAKVMRELFAEDRARQLAWIAEASGRAARAPRSRSSRARRSGPGAEPPSAVSLRAPALLAPAAISPLAARDDTSTLRRLVPIVLAIAIVVAVVVVLALAFR